MKSLFGIHSRNHELPGSAGLTASGTDHSRSNFSLTPWATTTAGPKIASEATPPAPKVGLCGPLTGDHVGSEVSMDEMMIRPRKESPVTKEARLDCEQSLIACLNAQA